MSNNKLTVALIAVAIIAIVGVFTPIGKTLFGAVGGVTALNSLGISQLKIGATCNDGFTYTSCVGTAIKRINVGTCNIHTGTGITSINGWGVQNLDCQAGSGTATALTGVTTGDMCHVSFATTTTANEAAALTISGVSNGSTTQGYIALRIVNATSSNYTWASTATSGLPYICVGY